MNSITDVIYTELDKNGIVVLPPMDVFSSIQLLKSAKINVNCTILDPWYNKGYGGVLPDEEYDLFIRSLLNSTSEISDFHIVRLEPSATSFPFSRVISKRFVPQGSPVEVINTPVAPFSYSTSYTPRAKSRLSSMRSLK